MHTNNSQRQELRAALVFGGVIAAAVDAGWLFTLYPYMGANPWRWPIAILTCVIQTVCTVAGVAAAARLHHRLGVNLWLALPFGALAGAAVGAVSIGLSIGVRAWLGMRSGMIVMLRESAWLNTAPVWRQIWEGLSAGLAFGAVGGFLPGALGSLALSLRRRFHRPVSASPERAV